MRATCRSMRAVLALLCAIAFVAGPAQAKEAVYRTGFDEWLAAEGHFSDWQKSGTLLSANGELELNPATAALEIDPYAPGDYYGGNFYTGGTYWVGEATGPATPVDFDLDELIPSWNAVTPAGTWIEVLVRAELDGRWTTWYNLGIWASGLETVRRHSVRLQADDDAHVGVDTLLIDAKKAIVGAYQLRVRLFSVDGLTTPAVRYLSAAYSTTPTKNSEPSAGNPAYWNTLLPVPECSQMVYPDGGNVWCSPTSTAMIVSYWQGDTGPCEPAVRAAVAGIYDWIYDGTGNWPFNTAYPTTHGLQGSVRRFGSMDEVEVWVAQGVPVAISFSWGKGQLTGAAVNSSAGHLSVVVGFDGQGNPIVNDPAAGSDQEVQRTYQRSELEPLWLENSGGTVYLIEMPSGRLP
ncbi:MAG TPA: peptidase C39 family protein [Anaerolineae bacterium]|nr:peptidase C39 family protein [Anaerolineae bacterium]